MATGRQQQRQRQYRHQQLQQTLARKNQQTHRHHARENLRQAWLSEESTTMYRRDSTGLWPMAGSALTASLPSCQSIDSSGQPQRKLTTAISARGTTTTPIQRNHHQFASIATSCHHQRTTHPKAASPATYTRAYATDAALRPCPAAIWPTTVTLPPRRKKAKTRSLSPLMG